MWLTAHNSQLVFVRNLLSLRDYQDFGFESSKISSIYSARKKPKGGLYNLLL